MNAKPSSWQKLNGNDQIVAKVAAMATCDTINGGAATLAFVHRLEETVNAVYSESTGKHSRHGAWECDECGSIHLGKDAAEECCNEEPEPEPEEGD